MNLPKNSRGFTIIELLVTMSIITIIAGGIIPTFSSYIKNQNLKQAQEQLKSDLRTVQNRALTGALSNEDIPNGSGNLVKYWGVLFPSESGASMSVFVSTNETCNIAMSNVEKQNDFNLPNDVMYFVDNSGCIFFNMKNGDITDTIGTDAIRLKFKSSDPDALPVNFNSAGLIWTENN